MQKKETLQTIYRENLGENQDDIGHFNVFEITPFRKHFNQPLPYKKRDYFKVGVLKGKSTVEYADKVVEVPKQALIFSNPFIPYRWQHSDDVHEGYYAIFNEDFFYQKGFLTKYDVFKSGGNHVFELSDDQLEWVKSKFHQMMTEIESDYQFKYDLLRVIAQELIHFGQKLQPSEKSGGSSVNASQRIAAMFLELLERQFPIDEMHAVVHLRTASDYAEKLNIHTNHLNRALKEVTHKTTTELIAERVLQEAKTLLRQTAWPIADIAHALGFTESTHFNNFFKKHVEVSPRKFRNV